MTVKPGCFISIEGTEGTGKSTQIKYLCQLLESQGIKVELTREPGGTELAESLRDLLLKPRAEIVSQTTELLLMFAARSQHIENLIRPTLAKGIWVITDRFTDATFAYQGGGRGVKEADIKLLENLVQRELRPDLTLLLDMDANLGLKRAQARSALDRFEQEEIEFFKRVRNCYLQRATAEPKRFALINAENSISNVNQQIKQVIMNFITNKKNTLV